MCVVVFNIKASYAKRKRRKAPALRVRIRGLYVLRPSGKYRHTSQSQRLSPSSRGSKTGLMLRRPFAFCSMVVPVYVLSCFGQIPDTLEDVWVKIALEGEQEALQLIDRTTATRNPFDAKYSKVEDAD